jgi:hypothetical protein
VKKSRKVFLNILIILLKNAVKLKKKNKEYLKDNETFDNEHKKEY